MKRYKGEFDGRECTVSEVTDSDGDGGTHYVVTVDGNTPVRTGDYVVHGLAKAPRGYHSQVIDKVVRGRKGSPVDSRLTIGEEIEQEEIEDEPDFIEEDDEFVAAPASTPAKKAAPAKAAPAK